MCSVIFENCYILRFCLWFLSTTFCLWPPVFQIRDNLRRIRNLDPCTGLRIRILLFSLTAFNMPTKIMVFYSKFFVCVIFRTFCRYIYIDQSSKITIDNESLTGLKTVKIKIFLNFFCLFMGGFRIRIINYGSRRALHLRIWNAGERTCNFLMSNGL